MKSVFRFHDRIPNNVKLMGCAKWNGAKRSRISTEYQRAPIIIDPGIFYHEDLKPPGVRKGNIWYWKTMIFQGIIISPLELVLGFLADIEWLNTKFPKFKKEWTIEREFEYRRTWKTRYGNNFEPKLERKCHNWMFARWNRQGVGTYSLRWARNRRFWADLPLKPSKTSEFRVLKRVFREKFRHPGIEHSTFSICFEILRISFFQSYHVPLDYSQTVVSSLESALGSHHGHGHESRNWWAGSKQ